MNEMHWEKCHTNEMLCMSAYAFWVETNQIAAIPCEENQRQRQNNIKTQRKKSKE